jgi:hypothetical protein
LRLIAVALAVVVGIALSAIPSGPTEAASNVQIPAQEDKGIQCDPNPEVHGSNFDQIDIVNLGDAPQDLTGWELRSDPEDAEKMSLSQVGTIAPGERVIIVAGSHSQAFPNETPRVFQWSVIGVLREGPPMDYVKIFDSSGQLVFGRQCDYQLITDATPSPEPTAVPQAAAQNQSNDTSQTGNQNTAANTQTNTNTTQQGSSNPAAAPVAAGGGVPAPNSGVGALTASDTGLPGATTWALLLAGLSGLFAGTAILRHRITAVRRIPTPSHTKASRRQGRG